MIFSHFNYCTSCWSQASKNTLKPTEILYKRALKVLEKNHRIIITVIYSLNTICWVLKISSCILIFDWHLR
ncbi:hypothetical protein LDENG_00236470 [Lucifuga dentata]|nr:hypothetical protein LDENG_00236470 [Lucifuga dentata]